jgi:hypothetical protein
MGETELLVVIRDYGVGVGSGARGGKGLGIGLDLTRAVTGDCRVDAAEPGTVAVLRFPFTPQRG